MPADEAAEDASDSALSWRELAVARSLDPARARAESRVQRFLDAALELMNTGSDKEFTVQEVVERSASRYAASTSTSRASTSFCWRCSRRRCGGLSIVSKKQSPKKPIRWNACTVSRSSTTGCAGRCP